MARLAEVRIKGLRSVGDVTLSLGGLTVLIGDNGSGKSSLLEAVQIVQLAAVRPNFAFELDKWHALVGASGDEGLKIWVRVEAGTRNLVYTLQVDPERQVIEREAVFEIAEGVGLGQAVLSDEVDFVVKRVGSTVSNFDRAINSNSSIFEFFGQANAPFELETIRGALEGIDSHLPFDVTAGWANRVSGRSSAIREPRLVAPSRRLELFGINLANVYQTLKNSGSDRWRETLELLQLGFGPGLLDVSLSAVGSGGHLGLSLELRGQGHVPALHLADGQLSYLAFVALVQLDEGRTCLTFDEPESHLHPALLGRVLQLFEHASKRYPVVLATHSDRLLDFLPDPAASVRVCELDADYRTRLRRLDPEQLDKWMARYRGLGQVRAEGHLDAVLADDDEAGNEDSAA